jgi:hypothetical protein
MASNARARGRYGQARLAKKSGGVNVGLQKLVKFPDGKVLDIPKDKFPDVVTSMFAFECKHEANIPKYLTDRVDQAVRNAPNGLIPVAVIRDKSRNDYYYIMREKDWIDLHG